MNKENSVQSNLVAKSKVSEGRELLRQQLLFKSQELLKDSRSDNYVHRELQKIELLGGRIIDLNEVSKVISESIQKYEPKFSIEFYSQVYRLLGLVVPPKMPFKKPAEIAFFTNEVIYGRFRLDVLPALQLLNPFVVKGQRKYKHFQLLTDEGLVKLERFIEQTISLMIGCTDMYEFRQKLYHEFGVSYQLNMFKEKKLL